MHDFSVLFVVTVEFGHGKIISNSKEVDKKWANSLMHTEITVRYFFLYAPKA